MQNFKKVGDSVSLWNYTLSPGWSNEEVEVLKVLLIKYGIGRWRKIEQSQCLPGKSISQLIIQTQKLLGQQSLAEFIGLRIDLEKVFHDNNNKKGQSGYVWKNNNLINNDSSLSVKEKKKKIIYNRMKYSIPDKLLRDVKIPKFLFNKTPSSLNLKQIRSEKNNFTIIEKIDHSKNYIHCLKQKLKIIKNIEKELQRNNNNKDNNNKYFSSYDSKKDSSTYGNDLNEFTIQINKDDILDY